MLMENISNIYIDDKKNIIGICIIVDENMVSF
jgi:hypothetical protein